jgi:predicted ATPase
MIRHYAVFLLLNHITWHDSEVTKKQRQHKNGHKSAVIWFTGLSGSGKSTVSVALEKELFNEGKQTYRLDGDNALTPSLSSLYGEIKAVTVKAPASTINFATSPMRRYLGQGNQRSLLP